MRTIQKDGLFWENNTALFSPYTKPANDPLLQKQTYRAFSKQTIDLQGATTDLIADDPYQDNLARLYEIKQHCAHERN